MDISNIDYRTQQNQETPLPHLHDQQMNLKTEENILYEYQYENSMLNSKELIDLNEKIKKLKDELIRHKNLFKEESNILGNIIALMEERNSILIKNAEYLKSIIESYKESTKESSNLINNSVSYLNNTEVNEEKIKLKEAPENLKVQTSCCDGIQTFPDKWQILEKKIDNSSIKSSESCSVVCNFSVNVSTQEQTTDRPKINEIQSFVPKTNAQRQKEFRERKKLSRQGARVNNNNKERQKRYREQNRDKLKQREAERRERIQYLQSIAGPSTSSNTNRIELNNEEIITAQSSSRSEKIQPLSIQRSDQGNELTALQKKRERQQRYREQNRDKLKQREAERRRRLQNAKKMTSFYFYMRDYFRTVTEVQYLSKPIKDKLPLILAGDFNVNFAKDESTPLITFLQEEFQLQINNNPREPTTRYGTTIDAVFIRYLDNVMSKSFVTYFSYHRPIVTVIPSSEATSNITITEVTD